MCIEQLSHVIRDAVRKGSWKGIQLSRDGPLLSHLLFADDMVLFSEATEEQIVVIKNCLERFSEASGQRVSFTKSQITFSHNVNPVLANRISTIACMQQTEDMGRYLGVPYIHGRVTGSLFNPMLTRIDARLEGWRAKYLSLAGKITLAQSVLTTIPFYTMQSTLLPVGVCDIIDKKVRNFIWGSNDGERCMHLVKWNTVTRAKTHGGLGIRKARDMNLAFLAKVRWTIKQEGEKLWVKVLKSKYIRSTGGVEEGRTNRGVSNLWQGINAAGQLLERGIRKHPRNGRRTMFWTDKWIETYPLARAVDGSLLGNHIDRTVADYSEHGRGWKWEELLDKVPDDVVGKLRLFIVSEKEEDTDDIYWSWESSGMFSVSSAYHSANGDNVSVQDASWERIWKFKVPNRMKAFFVVG